MWIWSFVTFKKLLGGNAACLCKHDASAFSPALHPRSAHYCQRFDASPALSFVGHDGDSVSALRSQNSAQYEGSPKFIKGIICIWVPETFGASGFYFFFWIWGFIGSRQWWKAEISLLRTTSWRSGARWCTAPRLGWRRAATAPCSTPLTSSPGNTTHPTSPWLRTQVSSPCSSFLVNEWQVWVYSQKNNQLLSFVWSICFPYCKLVESSSGQTRIYCGRKLRLCGHLEISNKGQAY